MPKTDKPLKDGITYQLREWGFEVEQLETRPDLQTPDLLVCFQRERYIIELKGKGDDERFLREREAQLAQGEIVHHHELVGRRKPIARVIEEAVNQINDLPPEKSDFRLLWLHSEGRYPKVQMDQFHSTVYGTTHIVDLGGAPTKLCYYFYHNEFYRFRAGLDGVIMSAGNHAKLCLNNYSPRVERLRNSAIAKAFAGGICDPDALEEDGAILLADCQDDRSQPDLIIRYLQKKYGRELIMNMDIGLTELSVTVFKKDEKECHGGRE